MNSNAVAELAFGMMLMHYRNSYDGTSGRELRGRKLGLVGCGLVGVQMIKIAKGFGVAVLAVDPFLKPDDIRARGAEPCASKEDLFAACDFVSLHIPATPETTGSIGKDLVSKMPKDGCLINTARLEVVDEAGLMGVLAERSDLGYISDVQLQDKDACSAKLGDRFAKQVHCTRRKGLDECLRSNRRGQKGELRCRPVLLAIHSVDEGTGRAVQLQWHRWHVGDGDVSPRQRFRWHHQDS